MRLAHRKLPVARDEGLLIEYVGDETIVYDTESKEAHCLSSFAAVVFSQCDGRTTLDDLARIASERLGEPVSPRQAQEALDQLDGRDLLQPRLKARGISRREMIRRSAVAGGAVASAPLITSVLAPASAAAATATCGTFPTTVLCCPCLTDSELNKDECCEIPGVTNRCQCVKAESNESKFCKPSGSAAQGDAFCAANRPACQTCRNNQEAGCIALLVPGTNCTGS